MHLRKTPRPKRRFTPGPAFDDSPALLEWLGANSEAYLRLPVVIFTGDLGDVELAYIGTEPIPPPAGAITLDLDDSALGICLTTRLRSLRDSASDACVVWIEGTWGRLLPGVPPGGGSEPPPWPFAVRDAGPRVEGSPATILIAR